MSHRQSSRPRLTTSRARDKTPYRSELLELPSPFPPGNSRLLLLEPAGARAFDLLKQIAEGEYDKPFILDHGALRYLHFKFDRVESAMHRDDPDALCLAYTRTMMAFLLFNPHPNRILLLGLGGGSLAKFCYRRLPTSRITVLESDPNVLALREEFRVPSDDERFQTLRGDGVTYVIGPGPRKDVILVDAYDRNGVARGLATAQFYRAARRRLNQRGVLAVNVFGDPRQQLLHAAAIGSAFGRRVILLPVGNYDNIIVLAFRTDAAIQHWERLESVATSLKQRMGLDFPHYLRNIIRWVPATASAIPNPGG